MWLCWFLMDLGIGNIKGGLNADKLFDKLRSDQGVIIYKSKVTNKPRDVWSFHTPASKETIPWGAITGDIADDKIDIGDRSFANLLTPRRDAREAIFPKANGFHKFALFNGQNARQDEVPPFIAMDDTIPHPQTKRLQAADGCITCHSTKGKDGWQPMENDIKKQLDRRKLDIFGDFQDKRRLALFDSDTNDRIAGRYTGDFSLNITRARDDLSRQTLLASGPWEGSIDQVDICKLVALPNSRQEKGKLLFGME